MTERILVQRFEPNVEERGMKLTIDGKGIVSIKDHTTDKIIAIVNLEKEADKNMELAEKVIDAIEEYVTGQ